ncbi:membrane bound O-acyl transferase family-domain-containing protein [Aspergillus karnatakaensis]|uniref:wax synthase family protein n=1 Tax=Aspergillus karnatakaensis TaxID=1810916 RepID=UPI003CCE2E58
MALHPILSILGTIAVSSVIVGCTPGTSYAARFGGLILAVIFTCNCITGVKDALVRSPWAGITRGCSITLLLHYINLALLSKWSFHNQHGASLRSRLGSGFNMTLNWRFIGTPDQVKFIRAPAVGVSRLSFLLRAAAFIIVSYLFLDLMDSAADPELAAKYLSPENIPLLRRLYEKQLPREELIVRAVSGLGIGIALVALIGGCYNILAFFSVLSGLSAPSDWPPLFGSLSDAYTLRRVWSHVWHQTTTHKFQSFCRWLVHDVLGVPRQRKASWIRYAKVGLIFLESAGMHVALDIANGIPFSKSGALPFFCIQALGIAVEDTVINAYHYLRGSNQPNKSTPSAIQKIVGYVWVACSMIWTLPAYMYPIMASPDAKSGDAIVPVSLVARMR